jgi:hypothetical protein
LWLSAWANQINQQLGGAASANQTSWILTNPRLGSLRHPNALSK